MPLELAEAVYDDMPGIIDCLFESYSNPCHPFVDLLHPGAGRNLPEGKPAAIESFLTRWKNDPRERWLKVTDTEKGLVVGFSRWSIYEENPFPDGPPHVEATHLPEGSIKREYLTHLINERLQRQAARCPMPHIWLGTMAVRPAYRRHGAASTMMQWGIELGDEMKLPIFVEASWAGSQLYRRFGFLFVDKIVSGRPEHMLGNAEWDELQKEYPLEIRWLVRQCP